MKQDKINEAVEQSLKLQSERLQKLERSVKKLHNIIGVICDID